MKHFIIASAFMLIVSGLYAQDSQQAATERLINNQVWKPFKRAWEARDAEAYFKVHTKDVLRITPRGILEGKAYRDDISRRYADKAPNKRTIDFWMEHRIYNEDTGYEVGYFRITSHKEDGQKDYYYGRFSILLRKENKQWKIAQDWDIDQVNGREITGDDFAKGKILDLE